MSVTASITFALRAQLAAAADYGNPLAPVRIDKSLSISPGTGDGQADLLWADRRSLLASTPENIDLAGVLAGLLGGTLTFAEVTAMYLEVHSGTVTFFGAAANAFNGPLTGTTPKLTLGAGDFAFLSRRAGWGVTGGTGDIVLVDPGAAAAQYTLALIGRTVATP